MWVHVSMFVRCWCATKEREDSQREVLWEESSNVSAAHAGFFIGEGALPPLKQEEGGAKGCKSW